MSIGSDPIPIPDILGGPDFFKAFRKMKGENVGDYGKSDPPTVEDDMGGPFTCPAFHGTDTCPTGGMFSNRTYDDTQISDAKIADAERMADARQSTRLKDALEKYLDDTGFEERGTEHAPEGTPEERCVFHDNLKV